VAGCGTHHKVYVMFHSHNRIMSEDEPSIIIDRDGNVRAGPGADEDTARGIKEIDMDDVRDSGSSSGGGSSSSGGGSDERTAEDFDPDDYPFARSVDELGEVRREKYGLTDQEKRRVERGGSADPEPGGEGFVVLDEDTGDVLGSGDTEEEAATASVRTQVSDARQERGSLRFNQGLPFDVTDDEIEQQQVRELENREEFLREREQELGKTIENLPDADRLNIEGTQLESEFESDIVSRDQLTGFFQEQQTQLRDTRQEVSNQRENVRFELSQVDRPDRRQRDTFGPEEDPGEPQTGLTDDRGVGERLLRTGVGIMDTGDQISESVQNAFPEPDAPSNIIRNRGEQILPEGEARNQVLDLFTGITPDVRLQSTGASRNLATFTELGEAFNNQEFSSEDAINLAETRSSLITTENEAERTKDIAGGISTAGTQLAGLGVATTGGVITSQREDTPGLFEGVAAGPGLVGSQVAEDPGQFVAEEAGEEIGETIVLGALTGGAGLAAGLAPTPTPEVAPGSPEVEVSQGDPLPRLDSRTTQVDEEGNVISGDQIGREGELFGIERGEGDVAFESNQPFLTAVRRDPNTGEPESFFVGRTESQGTLTDEGATGLINAEAVELEGSGFVQPGETSQSIADFETETTQTQENELFRIQGENQEIIGQDIFSEAEGRVGNEEFLARTDQTSEIRSGQGERFLSRTQAIDSGFTDVATEGRIVNPESLEADVRRIPDNPETGERGLDDLSQSEFESLVETSRDIFGEPEPEPDPSIESEIEPSNTNLDQQATLESGNLQETGTVDSITEAEVEAFEQEVRSLSEQPTQETNTRSRPGTLEEEDQFTEETRGIFGSPLEDTDELIREPVSDRITDEVTRVQEQSTGLFSTQSTGLQQDTGPAPFRDGLDEVVDIGPAIARDTTAETIPGNPQAGLFSTQSFEQEPQQQNEIQRPLADNAIGVTRGQLPEMREEFQHSQRQDFFPETGLNQRQEPGRPDTFNEPGPDFFPDPTLETSRGPDLGERNGGELETGVFGSDPGAPSTGNFTPDLTGSLFGGGVSSGPVTGLERRNPNTTEDEEDDFLDGTGLF